MIELTDQREWNIASVYGGVTTQDNLGRATGSSQPGAEGTMKILKLSVCPLILAASTSASLAIDLVWEPTDLIHGVPTEVRIYIQADDGDFALGVWSVDIANLVDGTPLPDAVPDGGLFFDVDGPDDTDFTGDDGWKWQGVLDDFPTFLASVNPPEIFHSGPDGGSPFVVLAGQRRLAASIVIVGTKLGTFRLLVGGWIIDDFFNDAFIEDGDEPVFIVVQGPGVPTVSQWGMVVLTLLLVMGLTIRFGRLRRRFS